MADENNGSANPTGEDSKGQAPAGQPPTKVEEPSSKSTVDPAEQARRDQQSKKDQANSQKDELKDQVDYLSAKEAERARDAYVSELLSDKDKYPNVKPNDPLFKYATSKEEVEEIAKELQNKFTELQQNALASVQSEPEYLTDEQIAEEEKKLEKETEETGKSNFGNFFNAISRRKR